MAARVRIGKHVEYVGSQDWDRRIFDALIPLPDGTSYNSYLVKGSQATVLIDTVDPKFESELVGKIKGDQIDFVVINHVEQDHSGCLNTVLGLNPKATVLCSERARDLIITHLHTAETKIRVVKDGEEISLGDITLKFTYAPFVHWPETMLTYLIEDDILFSCDMFGSHLASSDVFMRKNLETYEKASKRYYAEIMMPFSIPMKKNLEKVAGLAPKVICPSHGPCWSEPSFIIDLYTKWSQGELENLVLIADISMHGSTKAMVERLTDRLSEGGVRVVRVDLTDPDLGEIALCLVDAYTVIIATPTVLGGPHPKAASAALLANALRPRTKVLGVIGSFGWGGKAAETLVSLLGNLTTAEILPTLQIKGLPDHVQMEQVDDFAKMIVDRHAAKFPK